MQHGAEPLRPVLVGQHVEWHAGSLDALLGAADPLCHGRLGNQERVRDFGRGQTAHRPQCQGDRRRRSQGGMAAHEEQDERVVLLRFILDAIERRYVRRLFRCHRGLPAPASQLATQTIGHAPRGDLNQPAARILGNAFARPLHGRRHQCLLNGILRRGEVAETADDRSEHPRRELAQQMLGIGVQWGHRYSSGGPLITWSFGLSDRILH